MATSRNVLPVPSRNSDLQTTWAYLEEGVNQMMSDRNGVSFVKYTSLYEVAYIYCTPAPRRTSSEGQEDTANQRCTDLYNNLVRYFATYLKSLKDKSDTLQDEALLQFYVDEWDRYTTGTNHINRLFTFLNRFWVRRERAEGKKGIYPLYTLSLVQWENDLFIPIQSKQTKLVGAVLRLIEMQRNGEVVDQGLLKTVVHSFTSLGIDEEDINKACLDVYIDHFERPFIEATEVFYKNESKTFLASNTVSDYLKKAEQRIKEEEDRVEHYLNTHTRKPLITKCDHVLIREHAPLMCDSFQILLDNDKEEDLQRMYSLLSRIPEGLELLRKKFEEHVKKAGLAAVSKLADEAGESSDSPKTYVEVLMDLRRKKTEMVNRCFKGDEGFLSSLDKFLG